MNNSDTPPTVLEDSDPVQAGEHDIFDVPNELIVFPELESFPLEPEAPPVTARSRKLFPHPSSRLCIVLPLCAAVVVAFTCFAAFLAAPARFRLDPTPDVVHVNLKNADGTDRRVPCDADGYFRLRPGTYRFTFSSGGLHLLTKELTLNSRGQFFEDKALFDFDRVTCRLVIKTGTTRVISYINGARAELTDGTVRLPVGRYDMIFLAEGNLSDVVSVDLRAGMESLTVNEFPWRFRDGNRSQHEHVLAGFFGTLYALDPLSWNAYAPGELDELIDFFYRGFCVSSTLPERIEQSDEPAPRREDDSLERRLTLLRDRIRVKIQSIILELDADVHHDADVWARLLRATAPWENQPIEDWRFHHARCLVLFHTGQWKAAEKGLKKSLDAAPSEASLHVTYARLLTAMGRFEEARDELKEAFNLDSSLAQKVEKLLAEIVVRKIAAGKYEEPEDDPDEVPDEDFTVITTLDDALDVLTEALEANSEDIEALFLRSLVYIGLNRDAESDEDWWEFEQLVEPEMRAWLFEKELERARWKERFRKKRLK